MKTKIYIICFFLIFLVSNILTGQCYTILSIKGEIILEKTGKPIKELDEICTSDKVIFTTPDSKAAVLSSDFGRFYIKPTNKSKKKPLKTYIKFVLCSGSENLGTKGINSLEEEFKKSYFIAGTCKIEIDTNNYKINEDNFFYIKYFYFDSEINKRLKYSGDTLLIAKEDIYSNDEMAIEQDKIEFVSLYYHQKELSKSSKITSFKLIFADEYNLYSELNKYITILKEANKNDNFIIEEVLLYLNDVYGNYNENNMRKWIECKFRIK